MDIVSLELQSELVYKLLRHHPKTTHFKSVHCNGLSSQGQSQHKHLVLPYWTQQVSFSKQQKFLHRSTHTLKQKGQHLNTSIRNVHVWKTWTHKCNNTIVGLHYFISALWIVVSFASSRIDAVYTKMSYADNAGLFYEETGNWKAACSVEHHLHETIIFVLFAINRVSLLEHCSYITERDSFLFLYLLLGMNILANNFRKDSLLYYLRKKELLYASNKFLPSIVRWRLSYRIPTYTTDTIGPFLITLGNIYRDAGCYTTSLICNWQESKTYPNSWLVSQHILTIMASEGKDENMTADQVLWLRCSNSSIGRRIVICWFTSD